MEELERQKAKAWVYVDETIETGLALTRKIGALTTIEELWGEIDGFFGDPQGKLSSKDSENVRECSAIFDSIERPVRLRAPIDNQFPGGVALEFALKLRNGMVLSTRELDEELRFEILRGISISSFKKGDEVYLKRMHDIHYKSFISLKVYSDWVSKESC